ncbi:MAG: ribonuclease activity regulator RraA [Anaerolineae bacterium]|nr:ribonuclease activity regulator RraA [Anaerolineae bacterium]
MTNIAPIPNVQTSLTRPDIVLPQKGSEYQRPDPILIQQLQGVSSATASAMLHKMGIRQTFIEGPKSAFPGAKIVGSAVTLQFMPQREDVASGIAQEYSEKYSALWAVLETIQPNDVLTIQAFGDPYTGCLGEMLITYFKSRGGVGIVADGFIRDWPHVRDIQLPLWVRGFTPNYASQSTLFPWAYNVPIACSRVLVLPGDIIIADDDGAVLIPRQIAPEIVRQTLEHEDWEAFSRKRMQEGGALLKYYPLNDEGRQEYEAWRLQQSQ